MIKHVLIWTMITLLSSVGSGASADLAKPDPANLVREYRAIAEANQKTLFSVNTRGCKMAAGSHIEPSLDGIQSAKLKIGANDETHIPADIECNGANGGAASGDTECTIGYYVKSDSGTIRYTNARLVYNSSNLSVSPSLKWQKELDEDSGESVKSVVSGKAFDALPGVASTPTDNFGPGCALAIAVERDGPVKRGGSMIIKANAPGEGSGGGATIGR